MTATAQAASRYVGRLAAPGGQAVVIRLVLVLGLILGPGAVG